MCGICGIAVPEGTPSLEVIRGMCDTIRHRGPDGEGVYVDQGIGLGMRRLAVIDLLTGQQPMFNETGSILVVFNGEIYNYQELKHELEQKGHHFLTTCDTEVLPHLYEEYGLDFPSKLNGIFAVALWDRDLKRLVLTRDRLGIKPLFYSIKGGALYFGSEVKCILAAGGSERELDLTGLDQFLTFEYTASPWTFFADVKKLKPGSWLTWRAGDVRQNTYWGLSEVSEQAKLSDDEWSNKLREVLDRAVQRQMISDVPLGSFLSGGIDSSILVSAMSRSSSRPVQTFSIGFANESYNELHYAREVARHCETDHHETILEPKYLDMVDEVIDHMDQPIGDFSVFPTLLVSKVARAKVTVVLSGDGGDELFAGYDSYVADRFAQSSLDLLPARLKEQILSWSRHLPVTQAKKGFWNKLRRFLEGGCLPTEWQHLRWMTFLSPEQKKQLYTSEVSRCLSGQQERLIREYLDGRSTDRLQKQLFCDTRFYLCENILTKVDLMSMATSLEARVPYLDNEVVDLVARMPSDLKLRGKERKYILKKAYRSYLPPGILRREKQGFSIPIKSWLNKEWNGLMHDVLNQRDVSQGGIFNWDTVSQWMRDHETGKANHSHILWALMVFHLWKQRFLRSTPVQTANFQVVSEASFT